VRAGGLHAVRAGAAMQAQVADLPETKLKLAETELLADDELVTADFEPIARRDV
jgi:hypothetical protein